MYYRIVSIIGEFCLIPSGEKDNTVKTKSMGFKLYFCHLLDKLKT